MQGSFKILFYENGYPLEHSCITRFINAFPRHYHEVVRAIVENSERVDEGVFRFNVAKLLPSFKMTRRGVFRGVKIDQKDNVRDPKGIIDLCWKQIEEELCKLKEYINEKISAERNRILIDLSSKSRDHVIEKCSQMFEELRRTSVQTSKVGRVGASKILFAVLPEVALPVDNSEWKYVFKTTEYREVLSTMVNEIDEWERKTGMHLDKLDPNATLPSIYNIMAMAARPLRI